MDNFTESIKVIRLRTASGGYYLAAHKDQESLSSYKPTGSLPENTKWKLTWLGGGKCCLKSIYGKVLTVRRGWLTCGGYQEPWPVAGGYGDFYLQVAGRSPDNDSEFNAKLILGNETGYSLEANDYGVFLSSTTWPYFRSMSGWIVEVVERQQSSTNDQQQPVQVGQILYYYNSGFNVAYGPGKQINGDVKVGRRD